MQCNKHSQASVDIIVVIFTQEMDVPIAFHKLPNSDMAKSRSYIMAKGNPSIVL